MDVHTSEAPNDGYWLCNLKAVRNILKGGIDKFRFFGMFPKQS